MIGATILVMTGFGVGWVNSAADYSRYLPRTASTRGVVFWPTFGGSLPVVILVVVRRAALRLGHEARAGRRARPDRRADHDPADLVPGARSRWSRSAAWSAARCSTSTPPGSPCSRSGCGPRAGWRPRIDGVLMVLGTIYIVWVAGQLPRRLHGVPDHPRRADGRLVRHLPRRPAAAHAATTTSRAVRPPAAGYGSVNVASALVLMLLATVDRLGTGDRHHRRRQGSGWLGFLLGPLGLGGRDGAWAYANLGVPVALVIGFVGYLLRRDGPGPCPGARRLRSAGPWSVGPGGRIGPVHHAEWVTASWASGVPLAQRRLDHSA